MNDNSIKNNDNNDSERNVLLLEQLSKEIHIAIASFLGFGDVVNYQSTCQKLKRAVQLHCLHKATTMTRKISNIFEGRGNGDDNVHTFERIGGGYSSFYFFHLIHSVKLSFAFKDQGWGNRKGQIYIIEKQEGEEEKKVHVHYLTSDNNLGRIIQTSPLAEHHLTNCELVFKPQSGCMYDFCYKVGGGGGHSISVIDIRLKSFVHSACIPLANILIDQSSSSSPLFTNMILYILNTVKYFSNETAQQQQQHQQVSIHSPPYQCPQPSLDFFRRSTTLDLLNKHDMEAVHMMLVELDEQHDDDVSFFERTGVDNSNTNEDDDEGDY